MTTRDSLNKSRMCSGLPLCVLWRISSFMLVWLAAVWNEMVTAARVSDTRKQEKGAHGHLKHWGQSCGDLTKKVWGQEGYVWHSAWAKKEGQKPNSCIEVATTERPGLKCDFYIKWDFRAIIVDPGRDTVFTRMTECCLEKRLKGGAWAEQDAGLPGPWVNWRRE